MRKSAMIEKTRVQLDLLPARVEAMDVLMERCEFSTRKELFDNAMSLFEWAVEAASKGKQVALYDEAADHVERVHFPALIAAARTAAKASHDSKGGTRPTLVSTGDSGETNKDEKTKRILHAVSVA
jgi:hypothetical protein